MVVSKHWCTGVYNDEKLSSLRSCCALLQPPLHFNGEIGGPIMIWRYQLKPGKISWFVMRIELNLYLYIIFSYLSIYLFICKDAIHHPPPYRILLANRFQIYFCIIFCCDFVWMPRTILWKNWFNLINTLLLDLQSLSGYPMALCNDGTSAVYYKVPFHKKILLISDDV